MKIETLRNEELSKEYRIFIPIGDINSRIDTQIEEAAKTFKMPGFREGKVPLSLVKRQIGQDLLTKEVQKSMDEALNTLFKENNERPALPPEISVESFEQDKGLTFKVKFDILPALPEIKLDGIEIESLEVEIDDSDVKKSYAEVLKRLSKPVKADAAYAAAIGDIVQLDFVGTIKGKEFEGGKANDFKLELGSGAFIQGFEEQLKGIKEGENKTIEVVFPDDYPKFGGQKAKFDVKAKAVFNIEGPREINEELVKKMGVQTMAEFDEMLKKKLQADFAILSRFKTKKILFDKLDTSYNIEPPAAMLEADFKSIWDEAKKKIEGQSNENKKSMKEMEEEYRTISKRRVKLGILLAEIAKLNDIKVLEEDIKAVVEMQIMQSPDREKEVREFYNDKNNLKRLDGPILEEKVVDFILSKASITVKKVSSEEFNKQYSDHNLPS